MRSASFAASAAAGFRQKNRQFIAAEARGGIHAADLRFDAVRDLFESIVARQMPVAVVDALEPIDVDHQACDRSAAALRARQFFFQALLQVAPIVPAGEEIGDAGAQQPRAVHGVFDANGRHRAQVREKIRAVMARKARCIAAAEAQCAGRAVFARQRHERGTF